MIDAKTIYELDFDAREKTECAFAQGHGSKPDFSLPSDRAWMEGYAYALATQPQEAAPAAVPVLTPDEARWAAQDADRSRGPSDVTSPAEYAMAGAKALAAKIAAHPAEGVPAQAKCLTCGDRGMVGGLLPGGGGYDGQDCPDCSADQPGPAQGDAELLARVKSVKSNLMHQRRFGADTLGAWRNAACRAEGDLEEAIAQTKEGGE